MGGKGSKPGKKNASSNKKCPPTVKEEQSFPAETQPDAGVVLECSSSKTAETGRDFDEDLNREDLEGEKYASLDKETSPSVKDEQVLSAETPPNAEEFFFEFSSNKPTENGSDSDIDQSWDEPEECVPLSDSISIFPDKRISKQGAIFEGILRSGAYGTRPIVLKLGPNDKHTINEAQIMDALNPHSHIVSLIHSDLYTDGLFDQIYIAMDKCHSENLREFVVNRKSKGIPFDFGRALEILEQIIDGMKYIHEKKIIHRDIKPDNILFSLNQKLIKIADFGSSVKIESDSEEVPGQFGTNGYRPPESLGKGVMSRKSDVFSLGSTFYYVLSNGDNPFGDDSDIWIYNMQNLIIDLSCLLVPNVKTFQHLIHCMIEQKHNNRPTICQVSEHPCWTGNEVQCDFDYHTPESLQISAPSPDEQTPKLTITTDRRQQLLKLLEDCRRRDEAWIAQITRIIIFDWFSKHLQLYNPIDNTLKQMQSMNEDMKNPSVDFGVVTLDDFIYVLMDNKSVYRLKYSDETATWERMADMIDDHGRSPPATVMSGYIYVVGGSFGTASDAMEKYEPSSNKWISLEKKKLKTRESTIIATKGFIYSIGGWTRNGDVRDVERFDPISSTWEFVSPMQQARQFAAAVEFDGEIFVLGGSYGREWLASSEVFDPSTNVWSLMKTGMLKPRAAFNAFEINGKIYAVGGDVGRGIIERYNTDEDSWEEVQLPRKLYIAPYGSAKVKI